MSAPDEWGSSSNWRSYPCREWTGSTNPKGYGKVYFRGELIGAHRREYILHYGSVASNIDIMHLCNNKLCYEINHLKAGSRSENMEYAGRCGVLSRDTKGIKNSQCKLSEDDVRSIREEFAKGKITQTALSSRYKVSSQLIGKIVRRELWTHL